MEEDNRIIRNQLGFTFLELLLVLSIVMILAAVILPFSEKRLQKISEDDALEQFMTTVHKAQLYAITHRERVTLKFENGGTTYKVFTGESEVILEGDFPPGMYLGSSIAFRQLDFAGTGYLQKTGKMIFYTKSRGKMSITFQLERGRMIVSG
ncbi:hypothetical protein SporoP37_00585 [Sporosarcina sp. P37]|uniref:competence type IV pilus minor pilin ComGD n=1 Tax=unclassified Sporosarcina TaxID=2647733 RepID=UPI0009C23F7F|nr:MULTISPECIES: competence type IV pilus minor pilin ComGD [unclassified Sporosarcina]ARD46806.1 hypothetical protein SporoP33_00175 [Sporosarcina sp. P33]ARK23333.1 hypothetical protein SporoP37_00585 [Sporosarcina sp. P37]